MSYVDKTSSGFNTKTYNTDNLKYLFQSTQDDPKHTGFICDFDITGALLNGDNTLKVYLYTAQVGTGSKLSFCEILREFVRMVQSLTICPFWLIYP